MQCPNVWGISAVYIRENTKFKRQIVTVARVEI